jgi:hypothetical protein
LHAPPGGKTSISFGDDTTTNYPANKSTAPYVPNNQKRSNQPTSMSNLLSQQGNDDECNTNKKRSSQKSSNASSQMSECMNPENQMPRSSTRVRQAPGGTSTFVLG